MKPTDAKTRPAPAPAKNPPVPLPDFEQIARSVLGMLEAKGADVTTSCLFFGLIAESILKRHYGLDARAVVGHAAFHIGAQTLMAFAPSVDESAVVRENFHCWVELNGWFLDFSSLVYPEIALRFNGIPCPRLMFQKPLVKAARSMFELQTKGAFYCFADDALTLETITSFRSVQQYDELIEKVTDGYRRPKRNMPPEERRFDPKHGHVKPAAVLSDKRFDEVWP